MPNYDLSAGKKRTVFLAHFLTSKRNFKIQLTTDKKNAFVGWINVQEKINRLIITEKLNWSKIKWERERGNDVKEWEIIPFNANDNYPQFKNNNNNNKLLHTLRPHKADFVLDGGKSAGILLGKMFFIQFFFWKKY